MNRMKTSFIALLAAFTLTLSGSGADLFSIQTAKPNQPEQEKISISVSSGEVLAFSAADLELRMGVAANSLQGCTLTSLPDPMQGALVLEGVEVDPYEFLTRKQLDQLCFVPNETAASASVTLLPQGLDAVPTLLAISVLDGANAAPTVEGRSFDTVKNAALSGYITASDPDGDALQMQVVQPPKKGSVSFNGQSFLYQPFQDVTGTDTFTVCAVDPYGCYSEETTMEIKIEGNRSGFRYTDMNGNPSEYAAIKLHEAGMYSGIQVGDSWFFQPSHQVNRGELLVMLLAASGMDHNLTPTVNTQLAGDDQLPMWLKPYVKKAVDEGIWDSSLAFYWQEIPTRAEAVALTDRTAKITDVKDFNLQIADVNDIPAWTLPSYRDLAAYRMLDLHDGSAHPNGALTASYAADLVWQLYKYYNHRIGK